MNSRFHRGVDQDGSRSNDASGLYPILRNSITFLAVIYRDVAASNGILHNGKNDTRLNIDLGGFATHAAPAAVVGRTVKEVHLVAPVPWLELPSLHNALPAAINLAPVVLVDDHSRQRLPLSVVRSDAERDVRQIEKERHNFGRWILPESVPERALRSVIVASGRVPPEVALAWNEECRRRGSSYCWCGGDSLEPELEPLCFGIILSYSAAQRLASIREPTPTRLALALTRRAQVPGAFRIVTGGGSMPAALAFDSGQHFRCLEAVPVCLGVGRARYLTGPGDVFAGRFIAEAFFDQNGNFRLEPEWERGLQHARFAAAGWVISGQHLSPAEIETAIARQPEYEHGAKAIRAWIAPKQKLTQQRYSSRPQLVR